jgi:U3 small nucleolar RNA-associated protein 12
MLYRNVVSSGSIIVDVCIPISSCRLRGHKDQITGLHCLYSTPSSAQPSHLISASKDTLCKIWDLTTHHCIETVVGHRSEIWSTALSSCGQYLITGTAELELKVWQVDHDLLGSKSEVEEGADVRPFLSSLSLYLILILGW